MFKEESGGALPISARSASGREPGRSGACFTDYPTGGDPILYDSIGAAAYVLSEGVLAERTSAGTLSIAIVIFRPAERRNGINKAKVKSADDGGNSRCGDTRGHQRSLLLVERWWGHTAFQ